MQEEKETQASTLLATSNPNLFAKFIKVVGKIKENLKIQKLQKQQIENIEATSEKETTRKKALTLLIDKKIKAEKLIKFTKILEIVQQKHQLDLQDSDTCEVQQYSSNHIRNVTFFTQLVIFLLQKNIKTSQEVTFLGKFIKGLPLFNQREELFQTSQLSNKIIQNLKSVFRQKHQSLFKYGDRGNEYFILLKGKAYCLVPYSNMIPSEQIKNQTKAKRATNQVTEDQEDEDFLFDYYPRHQCVKIYQPGQSFGEIALLTSESKRMASIVCKSDSWFMSLDREGFQQIQGSYQQHLLNERVYFLKKFDIFANIAVNKILSFLHEMQETEVPMGQYLYQEGEKVKNIYFLMEGEVELVREMIQLAPSRLQKQKYEVHFKNTKNKSVTQNVVLLTRGSYFGDEDLLTPGLKRQLSAVVKSQKVKVLIAESKVLAQYLKVYETFYLLRQNAQFKKDHYQSIISSNLLHTTQNNFTPLTSNIASPNSKQLGISTTMSMTLIPNSTPMSNANNTMTQLNNRSITTNSKLLQSKNNIKKLNDSLEEEFKEQIDYELKNKQYNSECVTRMNNVFTQNSNANMKAKNYMSIHSPYDNSCKFTIDDMPKTMTMNLTEKDLRRLQFNLKKSSIMTSLDTKKKATHFRQNNSGHLTQSVLSLLKEKQDSIHLPTINSQLPTINVSDQSQMEQVDNQQAGSSVLKNQVNYNQISAQVSEILKEQTSSDNTANTKLSQQKKHIWFSPKNISNFNQSRVSDSVFKQLQVNSPTQMDSQIEYLQKVRESNNLRQRGEQKLQSPYNYHSNNSVSFQNGTPNSSNLINLYPFSSSTQIKLPKSSFPLHESQTTPLKKHISHGNSHSALNLNNSSSQGIGKTSLPFTSSPQDLELKDNFLSNQERIQKFKNQSHMPSIQSLKDIQVTQEDEKSKYSINQKLSKNKVDRNSSPELFAMAHAQAIKGNEYYQKLLFKKNLSVLDAVVLKQQQLQLQQQ